MKTHMIHCNSEFRAYALIRQILLLLLLLLLVFFFIHTSISTKIVQKRKSVITDTILNNK